MPLFAGLALAQEGEIAGTIRVTKTLTRKGISLPQVYERNVALTARPASTDEELARVVVYLEGEQLGADPLTARMEQRGRQFAPEVLAVPVGSTVEFPNDDPIFHNVFSLSKAKHFDLGNYGKGKSRHITFDAAGPVLLHCHLHPNMSAAVMVTPNRFYTRPAKDGSFVLKRVPAGVYHIVAWHKSGGPFKRTVTVDSGGRTEVDIEIPLTEIASR